MPSYGNRCRGCSGEDCVCCEVYLEAKADEASPMEPPEFDEENDAPDFDDNIPEDNMTDAEADADTLKSAGMGTNEDYGGSGDDGCYDE